MLQHPRIPGVLGDTVNYVSKVTQVSVLEHQYIAGTEEIKLLRGPRWRET